MDSVNAPVWARLGVQLGVAEHDPHPPSEDPLALCAGLQAGFMLCISSLIYAWLYICMCMRAWSPL